MNALMPLYFVPIATAAMMVVAGFHALENYKTELAGRVLIAIPVIVAVGVAIFDYFRGTTLGPYFLNAQLRELIYGAMFLLLGVSLLALFHTRFQVKYSVFFWGTTIMCIATTFHIQDLI